MGANIIVILSKTIALPLKYIKYFITHLNLNT